MSQPYVGQILMFAGNFAPAGWMTCQGQTIPISENETLFQLIGTTYGGDGESTFNLPDLQGRVAIHQGTGPGLSTYQIGQAAGTESVTLNTNQIPAHNHIVPTFVNAAGGVSNKPSPAYILSGEGSTASGGGDAFVYATPGAQVQMSGQMVAGSGGSQPHENIQPILTITYIISLFGVFPTPN